MAPARRRIRRRLGSAGDVAPQTSKPQYAQFDDAHGRGPQFSVPRRIIPFYPRGFAQPYYPVPASEQTTIQRLMDIVDRNMIPIDRVIGELDSRNVPTQLEQAPFVVQITAAGPMNAQLLIPRNPNRMSFTISNFMGMLTANSLCFSYDAPIQLAAALALCTPVPPPSYQEFSGGVSASSIWVWSQSAADTFPFYVAGWEGTLSITGNKR